MFKWLGMKSIKFPDVKDSCLFLHLSSRITNQKENAAFWSVRLWPTHQLSMQNLKVVFELTDNSKLDRGGDLDQYLGKGEQLKLRNPETV